MKVLLLDRLPGQLQASIQDGQDRDYCPKCKGGQSRERSLSIRYVDDGIVKLSCWRASCGWYAVSFIRPDARLQSNKVKEARPFKKETFNIDNTTAEFLNHRYGLKRPTYEQHGWKETADDLELVMPVLSPTGDLRGHLTRTFTTPKRCMTYKCTAQPWLDWWTADATTVIVEDTISACRLRQLGYQAVALSGTNMSNDDAREIAQYAPSRVYLALDRDAFDKSIEICRRHRHIINMSPVCLDADIKDISGDYEITELFGEPRVGRDTTCGSSVPQQESV